MKNPADWKEEDLQNLIDTGAEEGAQQEFKSAAALKATDREKTEISKDVSSFANSAGGEIIYGMDEDLTEPHKATAISPIDPKQFSKEWLEQVINSRIQPRIQGLGIVSIDVLKSQPQGVCYVVTIPQSSTAHQAHDRRYYKRYNFQSAPMEDYEVRQAMDRRVKPTYYIELYITPTNETEIKFDPSVWNTGDIVGHEVTVILMIPSDLSSHVALANETEEIDGIRYTRVLATNLMIVPQVHPFGRIDPRFPNSARLPSPPPAQNFPVIIRVYDAFGLAASVEFTVPLISSPRGQITRRKELYTRRASI